MVTPQAREIYGMDFPKASVESYVVRPRSGLKPGGRHRVLDFRCRGIVHVPSTEVQSEQCTVVRGPGREPPSRG